MLSNVSHINELTTLRFPLDAEGPGLERRSIQLRPQPNLSPDSYPGALVTVPDRNR